MEPQAVRATSSRVKLLNKPHHTQDEAKGAHEGAHFEEPADLTCPAVRETL